MEQDEDTDNQAFLQFLREESLCSHTLEASNNSQGLWLSTTGMQYAPDYAPIAETKGPESPAYRLLSDQSPCSRHYSNTLNVGDRRLQEILTQNRI